jgi:bifunctional DNA-binding transcriptional regulator/antitoxin component of YhaV-PrlF toxin-antitoxin module
VAEMLTTLTERGQVSMPSSIRRQLNLLPGQPLLWKCVSDHEVKVTIPRHSRNKSMRGFIKKLHKKMPPTTAEWMKLLREGEND